MKLVLDTHILIAIVLERLDEVDAGIARGIGGPGVRLSASVVRLWEIAITAEHAVASVNPWPPTRDPFDRMLLAQRHVEGAHLVTLEGALRDHPLAAHFDG